MAPARAGLPRGAGILARSPPSTRVQCMREHLFTSESVTEGHPDKLSDQISDGILDAILAEDHNARVACETLVTTGQVVVAGEVSTTARVDIPEIVRGTIAQVGYNSSEVGFDAATCG